MSVRCFTCCSAAACFIFSRVGLPLARALRIVAKIPSPSHCENWTWTFPRRHDNDAVARHSQCLLLGFGHRTIVSCLMGLLAWLITARDCR